MNKKAQGLPLNTIVIAIIVIVVLIIVLVFFLWGTSSVANRMKDIFGVTTAGTDRQLAEQLCKGYCDDENYNTWCKKTFKIDEDLDGVADKDPTTKEYYQFYCGEPNAGDSGAKTIKLSCDEPGLKNNLAKYGCN